jgi:heat-inducible transcriptional repressor
MDPRKRKILEAIVEKFIETAMPIGSKLIYEEYDLDVSPATIRNEMALLEQEGYIIQPHTSAGRVPTSRAYRMFVDQLKLNLQMMKKAKRDLELAKREFYLNKAKEKIHEMVTILANVTQNVCFTTVPGTDRIFFMGLGNVLRQPEFQAEPAKATRVIEALEYKFREILSQLTIGDEPAVFIGEENILPEIQSCSLVAQRYNYKGHKGLMGILGSTRMNYAYNMAALKSAIDLLE